MDVYVLSLGDHLPDPRSGALASQRERLRGIAEMAPLAEELGFTGIAVGEHHFQQYIVSAPELLLAAMAGSTSRLRLATAVTLLASADPVRLAEQLNTLDVISGGRAEMTVARGVSSRTWTAFGSRDEAEVRRRFEENLQLRLRLLTEDEVTWQGTTRASLDGVRVEPRPIQRPHPPIWMGGGLSRRSAELAAAHALPLILPSTLRRPESHLPIVEHYRGEMRRHGHGGLARVGLPIHVFVSTSMAAAERSWRPYWEAYSQFAHPLRGPGQPAAPVDALGGPAVYGDPPSVAHRLLRLRDMLDLDLALILFDVGGIPGPELRTSIELFGHEVLPLLRGAADRAAPGAAGTPDASTASPAVGPSGRGARRSMG